MSEMSGFWSINVDETLFLADQLKERFLRQLLTMRKRDEIIGGYDIGLAVLVAVTAWLLILFKPGLFIECELIAAACYRRSIHDARRARNRVPFCCIELSTE